MLQTESRQGSRIPHVSVQRYLRMDVPVLFRIFQSHYLISLALQLALSRLAHCELSPVRASSAYVHPQLDQRRLDN